MNVLILSLLAVLSADGAPPTSDQKPAGNPARINACTFLRPNVSASAGPHAQRLRQPSPPDVRVRHQVVWEAGIRAHLASRQTSQNVPEDAPSSHERAKRVEWLGVRDGIRTWLLTAA